MSLLLDTRTMSLAGPPTGDYLELGGGEQPAMRPNLDIRPGPATDIVHDLNNPLPLPPGSLDTIFSRYAMEHVSWRRLPALLKECVDALKPGGSLIFFVPDTESQMRHLLEKQDWDDGGSMLFGGQDYPENSHKAFLCPALVEKWLLGWGCDRVLCCSFGEKQTDMVVQAWKTHDPVAQPLPQRDTIRIRVGPGLPMVFPHVWKVSMKPGGEGLRTDSPDVQFYQQGDLMWAEGPPADGYEVGEDGFSLPGNTAGVCSSPTPAPPYEPHKTYSRRYFDGGLPTGGGYDLYREFPCVHSVAQRVLAERPESVLDIGGGRGYLARRLIAAGVQAQVMDVSKHCFLTRAVRADNFVLRDCTSVRAWEQYFVPATEGGVDLAVSVALLDLIPEDRLPDLIYCLTKYTRRGLHGVNTRPAKGDRTRVTVRPLSWWRERLPAGHEVVEKDELESGTLPPSVFDDKGKVKLNLGSHAMMFHHGWENIDAVDLTQYAAAGAYRFRRHDLREGIPHATASVDCVYSSHALEHLSYADGKALLRSVRRAMKSGGALRILVPDAKKLHALYADSALGTLDEMSHSVEIAQTQAGKLHAILHDNHVSTYDAETLMSVLREAGFVDVSNVGFANMPLVSDPAYEANHALIWRETFDCLPEISLVVCASVP